MLVGYHQVGGRGKYSKEKKSKVTHSLLIQVGEQWLTTELDQAGHFVERMWFSKILSKNSMAQTKWNKKERHDVFNLLNLYNSVLIIGIFKGRFKFKSYLTFSTSCLLRASHGKRRMRAWEQSWASGGNRTLSNFLYLFRMENLISNFLWLVIL